MPNAKEPKAPCVAVWLSPHTMVMPGCVNPCMIRFKKSARRQVDFDFDEVRSTPQEKFTGVFRTNIVSLDNTCSGPMMCTIPWRPSASPKYSIPNSFTFSSRAITYCDIFANEKEYRGVGNSSAFILK